MATRTKKMVLAALLAAMAVVTVYTAKTMAFPGVPVTPPGCRTQPC